MEPPDPAGAVEFVHRSGGKAQQRALQRLVGRQDGVVSGEQLKRLGFSARQIEKRVHRGELTPLHRNVFVVGRPAAYPRGDLRAALLAEGERAFLSHRSAPGVYALRPINRYQIHVTVPGKCRRKRDNLIVHRTTSLHPHDVRTYNGLRVSSIPRMLIELSPTEPERELLNLATEADRRGLLHVDRLKAALERHKRQPGTAKLHRALGDYVYEPRDKSTFERDFAAFLRQHPEIPAPRRNVHMERTYELDLYWPEQRLVVELDGRPYHQAVKDRERDNAKDIWLQKRAIRIVRIRDFRFEHDRPGIRADLLDFLLPRQRADAA